MANITAKMIIEKAKSYIGTKESPANSNNVIFNTHYYGKAVNGSAYPWCMAYVWDIFRLAGGSELFYGGAKTAYCPALETYAINHGQWIDKNNGTCGDVAIMNFGSGIGKHTGFVICKNANGTYTTVEGNTSLSSNDNGGSVMIRTRTANDMRGFYRPKYAKETSTSTESKKKVAPAQKKNASYAGKYKVTVEAGKKLAVRVNAGTSYDKITSLPNGKVVTCYGYYNMDTDGKHWLYVELSDGTVGYMKAQFLTKK